VVTVCCDAIETIEGTLQSLIGQCDDEGTPFLDYEHVIIDGMSIDGTLVLARAYKHRQEGRGIAVALISEPDQGIYDAMNKGLGLASGEYIAFLNADDWYEANTLWHVGQIAKENAADCIGGGCQIVGREGPIHKRMVKPEMLTVRYPQEMPVAHQSLFVRTDLLCELGGFRTEFPLAADYDQSLRLINWSTEAQNRKLTWEFSEETLSTFATGGASYATIPTARDYRNVRQAHGWPWIMTRGLFVRNVVGSLLKHKR